MQKAVNDVIHIFTSKDMEILYSNIYVYEQIMRVR